jgi:hypothetical protein
MRLLCLYCNQKNLLNGLLATVEDFVHSSSPIGREAESAVGLCIALHAVDSNRSGVGCTYRCEITNAECVGSRFTEARAERVPMPAHRNLHWRAMPTLARFLGLPVIPV